MFCKLNRYILLVLLISSQCPPTSSQEENGQSFAQARIIGGRLAITDQAKFIASIRDKRSEIGFGNGHYCGGSLIKENIVLTAAHCLYEDMSSKKHFDKENLAVLLGVEFRYTRNENVMEFSVTKIWEHEKFDTVHYTNDIALLLLNKNVPQDNHFIKTIPLGIPVPSQSCKVLGWGVIHPETQIMPKPLLVADVEIFDPSECKQTYGSGLMPGMFCAGDWKGKTDACFGDSGGPLICEGELVGLVSWGISCGLSGYPGLYANVSFYQDWIDTNLDVARRYRSGAIKTEHKIPMILLIVFVFCKIFCK